MRRRELVSILREALGDTRLVWFGTRGDDVEAVTELPQLVEAFCLIAPYRRRSSIGSTALEDLTGIRPDLDTYDVDEEPDTEALGEFRRALLRVLSGPSTLFTYRPTTFLSAIHFARRDRCRYLGMFKDHQSAFEHKPWVETSLRDLGIAALDWHYIADEDQLEALHFLDEGPVVLRRSRTNGGTGVVRVDHAADLGAAWPSETEAYVSVAPFLDGGIPVNVGAVVWRDGVTVHPASLQLIGIEGCTTRPFGYCGNDFGAAVDLGRPVLDRIEEVTVTVGDWLRTQGYLGAFGVDYLVRDGIPFFTEVNPRFQGSTHASCQLSVELDESCLLLEHLAAFLGVPAPDRRSLWDLAAAEPLAHIVVHRTESGGAQVDPEPLREALASLRPGSRSDVLTRPSIETMSGATLVRVTVRDRITTTGFELLGPWADAVAAWTPRLTVCVR